MSPSASHSDSHISSHPAWQILTKVPKITVLFWVVKVLTTAMGEATSDYLVNRFDPVLAVVGAFVLFVLVMALQFYVKRYIAWVYWLAALMVSIFGTMAADVVHVVFHVPYVVSTIFFALSLVIIFGWWYKSERTLSIHSIYTRKRELFYWAAVLATFALGTATGDLTAYTFRLGFLASGILFLLVFTIPGIAFWSGKLNSIAAFWFAYILTRPLGASFADWAGKPVSGGGLGIGDATVSVVLGLMIVILVSYLTITGKDAQSRPGLRESGHAALE